MGKIKKRVRSIFENFEVGNKVSKQEYEEVIPSLRIDLVNMQYDLKDCDFQVLVLIAGNNRKEANEVLDIFHEWMDARYLDTHVFFAPKQEELEHPSYWRYWRAMPPSGRIGIFMGGWIIRALAERVLEDGSDEILESRIEHMKALEKCLVDNNTELIKLWLHVPKNEAKKNLKKAKKDPGSEPYIRQRDWEMYERYDKIISYASDVITETGTRHAPWEIIESSNQRHRNLSVLRTILDTVSKRIDAPRAQREDNPTSPKRVSKGALNKVDLNSSIDTKEYSKQLEDLQAKLNRLAIKARDKFSTVLMFEGWDAAGKGGVIRRITKAMFAEDYHLISIAAPTSEEKKHHYLWRFWHQIPRDGKMAIFDRSWYGRVLVERVEGFATKEEWQNAYYEINDFEKQLVEHGIVLCKFWLHIDPEEQLRRFKAREKTGYKKYKITDEDYRNREKWDQYSIAVNEMVERTSTAEAPWNLVPANDKKWARIKVLETVVNALKERLKEY